MSLALLAFGAGPLSVAITDQTNSLGAERFMAESGFVKIAELSDLAAGRNDGS